MRQQRFWKKMMEASSAEGTRFTESHVEKIFVFLSHGSNFLPGPWPGSLHHHTGNYVQTYSGIDHRVDQVLCYDSHNYVKPLFFYSGIAVNYFCCSSKILFPGGHTCIIQSGRLSRKERSSSSNSTRQLVQDGRICITHQGMTSGMQYSARFDTVW
jgi:hypothetical protein